MQELPGLFRSDNLTLYGCSIEVHPELTNPCHLWFSIRRLTKINWCSVGYSQVRSLQGSFGSHKEMFSTKLIVLNIVDKVVQQVCLTVTMPWVQAPQSHRQQVPNRWKYDLKVTFTNVNTKSDNL